MKYKYYEMIIEEADSCDRLSEDTRKELERMRILNEEIHECYDKLRDCLCRDKNSPGYNLIS